ncbi:MAG: CPBP family intramembrane metalloprotease [Fuerstiella sp.]|nr:CPBP family intramembrane metalloprotease [Fuerstiella sp.]MCP4785084.1 CPBP family intramembrane metalloprotease [Fuerstiella sp.]MCP4857333.1 CPBP family intramembrane metalloprotease [Fuerstiella sp.]
MPSDVLLVAQVNADVLQDIEITAGHILSGLLVLSALVGSLAMIAVWAKRIGQGIPALPAAARKPLCVPVLLLLCGLALTVAMATMVAGTPDGTLDVATSAESAEETPAEEIAASGSSDVDADDVDETEPAGDALQTPDVGASNAADLKELLVGTLTMNLTMFVIFGTAIFLAQQGRSRVPGGRDDLTYVAEQEAMTTQPSPQFGDLDAPPDVMTPIPSASLDSPYAPSEPFGTLADSADDGAATPSDLSDPKLPLVQERWKFNRELRYAFETFLVAYLPTAAVRILMVSLLPEAPSHPFLEMIQDGVDWGTMSLIAVMAVVVAPLVEELLYRVTILGGMMQQGWLVPGWIVSSVLFGFAHGFPDSIALLPLAFAIGYVYMRRRSYRTVMLIHLLFNGFNMVIAGASLI